MTYNPEYPGKRSIRIAIVDDHNIFVDGLNSLFAAESHITVVAEGYTGSDAVSLSRLYDFDILLIDLNLPDFDGLTAAKQILAFKPDANILALTMNDSPSMKRSCLEAGMKGYILKNTSKQDLLDAILYALDMDPEEVRRVEALRLQGGSNADTDVSQIERLLTKREKEVLSYILDERTTQQIAEELCLSSLTVETHRKNILHKLGVKNTAGLVKLAVESGFSA